MYHILGRYVMYRNRMVENMIAEVGAMVGLLA